MALLTCLLDGGRYKPPFGDCAIYFEATAIVCWFDTCDGLLYYWYRRYLNEELLVFRRMVAYNSQMYGIVSHVHLLHV